MAKRKGLSLGKKSQRTKLKTSENVADLKANEEEIEDLKGQLKEKNEEIEDLKAKYEEEKGFRLKYEDLVRERLTRFEEIEDLKGKYEELRTKYESSKVEKGIENDLKMKLKAKNEEIEVLGVQLRQKDPILKLKIQCLERKEKELKVKIEEVEKLKSQFQYVKKPRNNQPESTSYEHVIYNLKNYEDLISQVLTFYILLSFDEFILLGGHSALTRVSCCDSVLGHFFSFTLFPKKFFSWDAQNANGLKL